ncbi:4-alpha-glucanotransferase, partial [Escherichia coli]|uniref:4-alpha-glucanotransferase n=1 Tax=Escherichia coli TaxID=562 RepID=UPI001ADD9F3E
HLGTVPEGFRDQLDQRAVMGMRVMPFEVEDDRLKPPASYDAHAAAMTGTHDLATVAGWWSGRDIAWNRDLGRFAAPDEDRAR